MKPQTWLLILLIGGIIVTQSTCQPNRMATPSPLERPAEVPAAAWSRPIGQSLAHPGRPRRTAQPMVDDGYWQGAPLGGIGAGTIGRTYRGDFARWHLDIGRHRYEPLPANMFSVYMRQGEEAIAQALWTEEPRTFLKGWRWRYPVGAGTYYALYPRSWFVYEWEKFPARLSVEQFSPVIPHNYRESSFPVAAFLWRVANPTDAPVTVGILFTWQNLLGWGWEKDFPSTGSGHRLGGHVNRARQETLDGGRMVGVVLSRAEEGPVTEAWDGSFAIAALETPGVAVTYRSRFRVNGDGEDIWKDFAADGRLEDLDDPTPAAVGELIGAGLAVTSELAPGEERTIPIVLAWDLPLVQFGDGDQWYRRYTAFFGTSGRNAWAIAREALQHHADWRGQIIAWQQPILDDPQRPTWYKTALFNELYFVADGATAWVVDPAAPTEMGHFAQIECYDYPYYETLDVRFYGSFPLLMLWPELEKVVMHDFISTVAQADPTPRTIQASRAQAPRKVAGAVPHDLGAPGEAPWRRPNAYDWQDVNIWKDLNSKFVLLLYRDYVATGDRSLLDRGWPPVRRALDYLQDFDRDRDGLPDNEGIPDQTYDTWPMAGASAYCGGLWLAALEAAIEMGRQVGDEEVAARYRRWLRAGKASYETRLWNGRYYRYDTGGPHRDSIMADQLAGQWYADVCGLPSIVPEEHILSALRTVYAYNVQRFAGGRMGAVNGMRPDGSVDRSGGQSAEVWTGTTYALAAAMLERGLAEEAWRTAWGVYHVTYETGGFWFRTPEAWDEEGNFRASMYLRPGAIWAMEWALVGRDRDGG